jgi:phosphoesterase RecJ-like protein
VNTDTGSFRFQNATADTLHVAGDLVALGADPAQISECVFDNRTFTATRLLAAALSSLAASPDGKIVWAHVTRDDFTTLGAADEDTEGFVNYMRGVRGADVGLLFREMADGRVRVSLRGRETVDVGAIAQAFGGGGHRMAAGCTLPAPLAVAERTLVAAVQGALAGAHGDRS